MREKFQKKNLIVLAQLKLPAAFYMVYGIFYMVPKVRKKSR